MMVLAPILDPSCFSEGPNLQDTSPRGLDVQPPTEIGQTWQNASPSLANVGQTGPADHVLLNLATFRPPLANSGPLRPSFGPSPTYVGQHCPNWVDFGPAKTKLAPKQAQRLLGHHFGMFLRNSPWGGVVPIISIFCACLATGPSSHIIAILSSSHLCLRANNDAQKRRRTPFVGVSAIFRKVNKHLPDTGPFGAKPIVRPAQFFRQGIRR